MPTHRGVRRGFTRFLNAGATNLGAALDCEYRYNRVVRRWFVLVEARSSFFYFHVGRRAHSRFTDLQHSLLNFEKVSNDHGRVNATRAVGGALPCAPCGAS
eukprot:3527412-Prymnesium_polylepis.1